MWRLRKSPRCKKRSEARPQGASFRERDQGAKHLFKLRSSRTLTRSALQTRLCSNCKASDDRAPGRYYRIFNALQLAHNRGISVGRRRRRRPWKSKYSTQASWSSPSRSRSGRRGSCEGTRKTFCLSHCEVDCKLLQSLPYRQVAAAVGSACRAPKIEANPEPAEPQGDHRTHSLHEHSPQACAMFAFWLV